LEAADSTKTLNKTRVVRLRRRAFRLMLPGGSYLAEALSSVGAFRVREYGRLFWCPRFDEFREQNWASKELWGYPNEI